MANPCVFCGDDTQGLTDEHVIADWVSNRVYPDVPISNYHVSRGPGTDPIHEWTGKAFDLKVKALCKTCNNGWLGPIESRVQPILTPMILGQVSRSLRSSAQALLAFWATKTAMVANFLPPGPQLIPETEYTELRRIQQPLPTHKVWIANRAHPTGSDESPVVTILRSPVETVHLTKEQLQTLPVQDWVRDGHSIYRVTFAVGCVMFQVFGCDFPVRPRVIVPNDVPVEQMWPVSRRFAWPIGPGFDRDNGPYDLHAKFDGWHGVRPISDPPA